ncbi:MAG TPA: YkvA family protein [Anaerolineales bacterium]
MAERKRKDIVIPPKGGTVHELIMRLKLIVRLMGDNRVSPFLKLLPIASLAYLISPVDLIMGIPGVSALDDMAVVSLGAYLFIEFCPPDVVQEHMKKLTSNVDIVEGRGEVVDGEATDIPDDEH